MLSLITQLIKKQTPSLVTDPVQVKLLDIIGQRRRAHKPAKKKADAPEPASANVGNLMEVLRKPRQGRSAKEKA